MTTSIRSSQEQDARLLEQKDKIKAIYEMLHDIPDEKIVFQERIEGLDKESLYKDPSFLRWMALRIQSRIRDANLELQEAMARSVDGILDLSRKNLCDLTIKDSSAPLDGIWKVILSGNFFRTLPPFLAHKPFISSCDAVGNLEDVELQFHEYRRHNQVSLDLIETVRALHEEDFENRDEYVELFDEITTNLAKQTIPELGHRVHAFMETHSIDARRLKIRARMIEGQKQGGIRGFIPLEHFENLEILDLSHCQLEHRSPINWLSDLHQLKVLKLHDTPVKEIPVSIKGKQLEVLDMSATQITEVPLWLKDMHSLKRLDLNDTHVSLWPDELEKLQVDELRLDNTYLSKWPKLNKLVKRVSICSTSILEVPFDQLEFLQEGRVNLDENNAIRLRMQAMCAQNFRTKSIVQIVLSSETFINKKSAMPRVVKVQVVALEYFTIITMLSALQLLHLIALPGSMFCSRRNGMKSASFKTFAQEKAALGLSIYYLYLLFHLKPMQKLTHDVKTLVRFLKR